MRTRAPQPCPNLLFKRCCLFKVCAKQLVHRHTRCIRRRSFASSDFFLTSSFNTALPNSCDNVAVIIRSSASLVFACFARHRVRPRTIVREVFSSLDAVHRSGERTCGEHCREEKCMHVVAMLLTALHRVLSFRATRQHSNEFGGTRRQRQSKPGCHQGDAEHLHGPARGLPSPLRKPRHPPSFR